MKKLLLLVIGFTIGILYVEYSKVETDQKVYGSRNVAAELKATTDRANLVLETVEKIYIKKGGNPNPPKPNPSTCKCNGSKVITYADGNKSKCQCFNDAQGCLCKPTTSPQG